MVLFLGWNQYFVFILMLSFFGVSLYIILLKDCLSNHNLIKQNLGTPWIQIWLCLSLLGLLDIANIK